MKKRSFAALALALCFALSLMALPASAAGSASSGPEEVIYAKLDASGNLLSAYAVVALNGDAGEEVTHYGTYSAVQNLTDTSPIAYEDGAVTAQAAWGWATLNSDPMTTDHKLRVASLTKVVVGMCAMLLSEDGTVTLDAPIGTWWDTTSVNPWYPDTPVTIDTLLTHTSSLAASDSLSARTYSGARSRISGGGYRAVEPGDPAGWAYNNYGFAVLGMTLELAADTSLDYMLAEGLLDPLGIDAAFEGGSVDNTDLLATLYYYGGSLARSTSEQRSYTLDYAPGHKGNFFDGGFTCSAGDLAKLAAVLANDGAYEGQVLLSPESVAWMETPLDTPVSDGRSTFLQCRPLRYQEELYGREGLYYHTGSAYGQYALLSYDPDTGDGVVVLTSGADGVVDEHGIYAICGEIAQAVYAAVEEDT